MDSIYFALFVLKALHGLAPGYSQLKTNGDRAFSVVGPELQNSSPLADRVASPPTASVYNYNKTIEIYMI